MVKGRERRFIIGYRHNTGRDEVSTSAIFRVQTQALSVSRKRTGSGRVMHKQPSHRSGLVDYYLSSESRRGSREVVIIDII
jgi:hypothetical protein